MFVHFVAFVDEWVQTISRAARWWNPSLSGSCLLATQR